MLAFCTSRPADITGKHFSNLKESAKNLVLDVTSVEKNRHSSNESRAMRLTQTKNSNK